MNESSPRIWLITGAAGTLGSELVRQVVTTGDECIALDRDEAGLNRLHDEVVSLSGRAPILMALDLAGSGPSEYQRVAASIESQFGRLDCLVHNAAAFESLSPLSHQSAEHWMGIIQTGLTGPHLLNGALMPLLASTERSRLVFISDEHCLQRPTHWGAYGVAQAGRAWMARALSREIASQRPRVLTIDPGPFFSRLRAAAWPAANPTEFDPIEQVAGRLLKGIEAG